MKDSHNRDFRADFTFSGDRIERYFLEFALAVLFMRLLVASSAEEPRWILAYSETSYLGEEIMLTTTSDDCRVVALNAPAKSVQNGSRFYAIFFADVACTEPVAIVAPGQNDAGLSPNVPIVPPQFTLLGADGALSYRTIAINY